MGDHAVKLPALHVSRPSVIFPGRRADNDDVVALVRRLHRGEALSWRLVEEGVRHVFERCGSRQRYLDEGGMGAAALAAEVARECLERHGVAAADVDLMVYGGAAGNAREPSIAADVAARLGREAVQASDVSCGGAGMLQALHAVAGAFALDDRLRTALVCAAEPTHGRVRYDVQSLADLETRAADLTAGAAAAAYLVRRKPIAGGSARLVALRHCTLPGTPDAGVLVLPEVRRLCDDAAWRTLDVDHYLLHQSSESMILEVIAELGADPDRAVLCHSRYGDTGSTSALVALDQRAEDGVLRAGDRLVLASVASGVTVASAAAVWDG